MPEIDFTRTLPVVVNDRESELRTPLRSLHRLPPIARDELAPWLELPPLRAGENDLTRVAPGRPQAAGEAIRIVGRVLDEDLRPVRRTLLEIWNANTYGRYAHLSDAARNPAPLDPNFNGFGRALTDDDGRYVVRTIKPGAYVARTDIAWWRPPHVHVSVIGGGLRLVTQMYFPDEPLNDKDFIHLIVPPDERPRVIGVPLASSPDVEPTLSFDIVVRGRFQTPPDLDA
jgi:protocatechuate 3,4-dioxygenase, beta subunit